jgi:hypothetical protein
VDVLFGIADEHAAATAYPPPDDNSRVHVLGGARSPPAGQQPAAQRRQFAQQPEAAMHAFFAAQEQNRTAPMLLDPDEAPSTDGTPPRRAWEPWWAAALPPTWTTMPRAARIRAAQRGVRWRPPVIYVGDWVLNLKQNSGAFSKKRFLRQLAERAIVVVCHEYYTTKLCGDCGCEMRFPHKSGDKKHLEHKGTVYCANKSCPSGGQFQNRDVAAACNIVNRFIHGFFVGELGCFSQTANASSPRISLSGALNPPAAPAGVASSA